MSAPTTRFARPLLISSLVLLTMIPLAGAKKGAIRKLTYDPDAPVVELFDGIEKGTFKVRVVPRNEFSAKVYIKNTTNKPQTVELPKAAIGVHVLKQLGPFQQPGGSGIGNSSGSQFGSGQDVGGNLQASGNQQNSFFGNNGNGFFSIPPESSVQLQFNTVCLNHGKPTPKSKMTYTLFRAEDRVKSTALRQLLAGYDPRRSDRNVMQAAAWHLANDMSWKQLASKKVTSIGLRARPFLSRQQLDAAKALVADAEKPGDRSRTKKRVARRGSR